MVKVVVYSPEALQLPLPSACSPDKDCSRVEVEVEHVFVLEADFTTEVLSNDTLPSREECFIKKLFELLCQINILELALTRHSLLHEFDCFQSHVYYSVG